MAKRTSGNLAILIGAVVIPVGRGWTVEETSVNVDVTAAGDTVMDRENLRKDFTVDWRALLEVASPYVLPADVVGTKVAFSCEIIAADANGIKSGTALVDSFRIEATYDGAVELSGRLIAGGTALATDTSPAT
jgi:hypothetical protein